MREKEIDTQTDINGTNGFKLLGENAGDQSGNSVHGAGDVNNDGTDDLIIGAPYWNKNTMTQVGRSYVVFGERGTRPVTMELSSLDGNNGFMLSGSVAIEISGWSVCGAGDVNNDGNDDLLIGAFGWNSGTGRAFLVFGSLFRVSLSLLDFIHSSTHTSRKLTIFPHRFFFFFE